MNVQKFRLTVPEATDLRCPFTGRELDVYVSVCEGVATYSVPDAFTLTEPQESIDVLYMRASMRNGVSGVVPDDERLVDPYTGARMSLGTTPDGKFYMTGGFNPRQAHLNLADFLFKLSCGKVSLTPAPEAKTVPPAADETEPEESDPHEAVDEITEETAERMAKVIGADRGRTTVGVSKRRK